MKLSYPGVTFRETMAGPFSLESTDPRKGAHLGRSNRTRLAMHARIVIPDIAAFVDDPMHEASLSGSIDFAPLGTALPAPDGLFRLFAPSDDERMKLMVYELRFESGGTTYYLAGKKEVRNDRGLDLWPDTTTLYTRLHRGSDDSAPVIGAGVLSLGIVELLRLMSTMRAVNANNVGESARAISTFGGFFARELWDTYVRRRPVGA